MILQKHAQTVNILRIFTDLLVVFFTWVVSFLIRFNSGIIGLPKGDDTLANYLRLSPVLLLSYFFAFLGSGVYDRALQRRRIWEEHFDLARSHVFSFFVFVTITFFLFEHRYSRITLLIFFLVVPVSLPLGRSVVRKINRAFLKRTRVKLRALLVGSGAVASRIAELTGPQNEWRVEIKNTLTFFDHSQIKRELANESYDMVFLAPLPQDGAELNRIYEEIGNTVAEVVLLPDFGMPMLLTPRISYLAELPALVLNASQLNGYGRVLKRAFDIVFSLSFIVLFAPVYLICALLVRLSSKGPVLYSQERMGLDGNTFQCLKFRGMYVDAESSSGPVWAKKADDRVTPIGKWLRSTSLDEIPQFFNVLRGEMSVVGPRPERPVFVADFRSKIPGYMLRHRVKAGITGWAQINGWRGDTSLEKRIACDLWYLQNWTIWLDLKICLMTPVKGFIHPNAY